MKLFKVIMVEDVHIQLANNADEAIQLVREKTTIDFLPYTASEIDLEGYKLVKK